ncbi:MAG: hypothetical protein HRT45_17235 [Bdellovibrionales bacterium]|nr:hypothetical protein [Bdellovibrionales bacterium]
MKAMILAMLMMAGLSAIAQPKGATPILGYHDSFMLFGEQTSLVLYDDGTFWYQAEKIGPVKIAKMKTDRDLERIKEMINNINPNAEYVYPREDGDITCVSENATVVFVYGEQFEDGRKAIMSNGGSCWEGSFERDPRTAAYAKALNTMTDKVLALAYKRFNPEDPIHAFLLRLFY